MSNFRPIKPRKPGSLHKAITDAISQVGTLDEAAEVIERQPYWLYTAADPDVERRKVAHLTYADSCKLAKAGGTALAEHIAHEAGGVFIPAGVIDQAALQAQLATFTAESGELVSETIKRIADGEFDHLDGAACLPLVEDVLRPLLALHHHCKTRARAA